MFLIDADILNFVLYYNDVALRKKLLSFPYEDVAISTVTIQELLFKGSLQGLHNKQSMKDPNVSPEHDTIRKLVIELAKIQIIPYSNCAESLFYRFKDGDRKQRPYDSRLAAHAHLIGAVVVTNNIADFEKIKKNEALTNLGIVNWKA